MSWLATIARTAAALAACACASATASKVPPVATVALYDANAFRPTKTVDAPVSAPAPNSNGSSLGATPIGDFVRSRSSQLQFCYEETRAQNPGLAGSATIGVLLAPDGSVTRADVLRRSWQGSGADQVEGCVLAKVKLWKFPADGSNARPYSFSTVFTR